MAPDGRSETGFSLHFPSCKVGDVLNLSQTPRRNFVYQGETIDVLLIAKYCEEDRDEERIRAWRDRVLELSTAATATSLFQSQDICHHEGGLERGTVPVSNGKQDFRDCVPLLLHNSSAKDQAEKGEDPVTISDDTVVFPLRVSLDKLPVGTKRVGVSVVVWNPEVDSGEEDAEENTNTPAESVEEQVTKEVKESSDVKCHVRILLCQYHSDRVTETFPLLPPPLVKCRKVSVGRKHFLIIKVYNSSCEDVTVHQLQIIPNCNAAFQHDGAEKTSPQPNIQTPSKRTAEGGLFSLVHTDPSQLPSHLQPLEELCLVFQIVVNDNWNAGKYESHESALLLLMLWQPGKAVKSNSSEEHIHTHYSLPVMKLDEPQFIMNATCPSPVYVGQRFDVKYTLVNNLQDFLTIKLVWSPEKALQDQKDKTEASIRSARSVMDSVVCHTPSYNLGFCKCGSTVSFTVPFQVLRPGLFEVGQHMKLKLQFNTITPNFPHSHSGSSDGKSTPGSSFSRTNSPNFTPDKKQGMAAKSYSFTDSTSAAIVKTQYYPAGVRQTNSPTHSQDSRTSSPSRSVPAFLAQPPAPVLSLDKIMKHNCKVYVMEPNT
ncbi:trafficking protein particle complex subunit 14-like isoform X1 [Branchiostoma floridae x Branchiostoma japonicum]